MTDRVRFNQGFAAVPDEFIQDERTTAYHIALFAAIAMHANGEDRAWPSVSRLAKLIGASRTKVKAAINELVEWGWITKHHRWNAEAGKYDANIYELSRSLQGRSHGDRGVGHETTGGRSSGVQEPDPLNQTQLNQTSRAIARVAKPDNEIQFPEASKVKPPPAMKDPLQRYIDEAMRSVQPYENFARERGQIKTLAARCRRRDPDNPQFVADAMMAAYRALRDSDDKWWSKQPFTPSALSSLWERIESAGGQIAEELEKKRAFQQWLAQG